MGNNKRQKKGSRTQKFYDKISGNEPNVTEKRSDKAPAEKPVREKKDKKFSLKGFNLKGLNKKKVLKILLIGCVAIGIIGCTAVGVIIAKTPSIETDKIAEILTESTIIYDDKGNEVDTVFAENNRTNVKFEDLPDNMVNALVALEDKTFWDHNGFNFIRIGGAIVQAVFTGGDIGGTSTLTQQLARNLFLQETQFDRSYVRKIQEAYYSIILERELTKEQIIETYCNTVYFGFSAYGVQAASQAYFSKDIGELTLEECAALAAMPQKPTGYQLVMLVDNNEVTDADKKMILKETANGTYLANDTSKGRRETCLALMLDQGYITQEQHDKAVAVPLKKMLDPTYSNSSAKATYFQDYVISEVIDDLMEEKDMTYDEAWTTVYQGGVEIYSTMDKQAQEVIEKEFEDDSNFPGVSIVKDKNGNLLNQHGEVTLLDYDNYFNKKGTFTFKKSEIKKNDDGSFIIKYGKRLNIYETEVNGAVDYSIEFKPMYKEINGELYSISGGFVNIPQEYKTMNKDGDIVIAAEMMENELYEDFFIFNKNGTISVPSSSYTLQQSVVQPQAAMTIVENDTGYIKAMVGGRSTYGRQLHNRAISPQQPGSSIKPLGVYSAALQQSCEEAEAGKKHDFKDFNIDQQGDDLWGHYITAGSIVVDEKTTIDGRVWPYNAGAGFSGIQTFRTAIQQSINTCAVKIILQVTPEYSAKLVDKYGISTLDTKGDVNDINPAALALGGMTEGVTTLDMASAYTVYPNNGTRHETTPYIKVVDRDGNVLLNRAKTKSTRVLDAGVAFIMRDLLHGVVSGGTGSGAAISGVRVGGKTGTTDNEFDIWFDGFTPSYSAALWIGNDQNFELDSMSGPAAALWGTIMDQIDGAKKGSYPGAPSNVVYSGGEYYISGTKGGVPKKKDLEKKLTVCEDTGYLATPNCPDTEKKKFLNYGDAKKKIPKVYCHKHNPDPGKYPISKNKKWSDDAAIKKKQEEEKKAAEEAAKQEALEQQQ
ncbi:MAG: transglycosylase domain-containing protein, partial [Firmicutes bacterium]|nr:transglycosylase domain-containing protein [Bacillota bacterium]